MLTEGTSVTDVILGVKRFKLELPLEAQNRTPATIANALIDSSAGAIPISYIADIQLLDGPNQVLRENGRRRLCYMPTVKMSM